jgi:hypothetical protein
MKSLYLVCADRVTGDGRPPAGHRINDMFDASTNDSSSDDDTDDTRISVVRSGVQRAASTKSDNPNAYELVSSEPRVKADSSHSAILNSRKSLSMDDLSTLPRQSSVDSNVADDTFQLDRLKFSRKVNQSFRAAVDKSYDVPSASNGGRNSEGCASYFPQFYVIKGPYDVIIRFWGNICWSVACNYW